MTEPVRTFLGGAIILDRGGFGDPTTFKCRCGTPQPFRMTTGECLCPKCCEDTANGHRFGPHVYEDLTDDQCLYCGILRSEIAPP